MNRFALIWFLSLACVFNIKAESIIPEKVVMETDRDIYIAGEEVYFSVFLNSVNNKVEPLSNICYIVLRNERNTVLNLYVKTQNKSTHSSFYLPDTLKTGYYELVAFTNYMRNFGEETYFRKQLIVVNRFDEWLTRLKNENHPEDTIVEAPNNSGVILLNTGKDTFGMRERVNIEIESPLLLRNVSITVKELNPISLLLLKQPATFPALPKYIGSMKYKVEINGIHLNGKVTNGNGPVGNECLFISTPDTFPNLQYTFTNKDGEYSFILSDYYLGKPAIIATLENYQGKYRITVDDKFKLSQPFVPDKKPINTALRKYILESQNIVKVRKAYKINFPKKESQLYATSPIPYVYREPTNVVFPMQFVVLNNFEEIVNNLPVGFRIKTRDGISSGYNLNPATGFLFDNPGAIFLNGVYIYNLNNIMSFTTTDINKIEVCNDNRIKGRIQFQGIISINTAKKTDYAAILPGSLVIKPDNALPIISYAPPRYESNSSRDPLPDFRQTLYWNVMKELNDKQTFDFYTSDWPGDYIVEVKGTTPEGNRISSYKLINIR